MRDKRKSTRYHFDLHQQIADISDGNMPSREDFRSVRCVNISRSGFAFYQESQPAFDKLVVALSVSSDPIYLTASVVSANLIDLDGESIYRVGCQFTGRLQWSEQTRSFLRKGDIESAFLLMSQSSEANRERPR